MLATIALVLILGLSAYYKQASIPDAEISVQSKEPAEIFESVSINNDLSDRIKQLVKDLEYPDKVAEDLTRTVMDWKDEKKRSVLVRWKGELSNAHQQYQEGKITRNDIVNIEESILREFCHKIRKQFNPGYVFELSNVIENRQANCLGYSQLIYIIGNTVGLKVRSIDVLNQVKFEENDSTGGHVACIVDLFDGRVAMVDMTWFYSGSLFFKLEDHFIKIGNFWELKNNDNPLLIHRRFRFLDRKGFLAILYNNRGGVYNSKGKHDRAILKYNRAIEIDTKCAKAYNNRGNTYKDKGDFKRAIQDYTKAIEIDPSYAKAFTNRGNAFDAIGKHERAIEDHTKAIGINPKFSEAYNNRGVTYAEKGEFDRAILDFTKAIEINPKHANAYINRGGCYCEKEEYDRALLDFNKAIELNPNDAYAYTIRGNIYYVKNEYNKAILNYDKAIEIDPEDAVVYLSRGDAYSKIGKSEEAKKDLLKALELDPELREHVKKISEQYQLDLKLE